MISDNTPKELRNLHNNVHFKPSKIWRIDNLPSDGSVIPKSARRKEGQNSIIEVLKKAELAGVKEVRALGGSWSLSEVANTRGWLLQTTGLTYVDEELSAVHPGSPFSPADLTWVQSGTRVAQIHYQLGKVGRSLLTCGASNGQTLAGATATGTHGAAFKVGALHDTIRALHIIVSSTRSVWIEAASAPVVPDESIRRVCGPGVEIIRDTSVLRAAQVSFGSFGVVESMILSTEKLFLLSVHRKEVPYNAALKKKIHELSFNEEPGNELYHLEVTFDPEEMGMDKPLIPWVTTMYKSPASAHYDYENPDNPKNVMVTDPAAICWGGMAAHILPEVMLQQAKKVLARRFVTLEPKKDPQLKPIPLGVVFTDVVMDNLGASTEIGVAAKDFEVALEVIRGQLQKSAQRDRPFLGPVSLRFVKGSDATLAFTRFKPVTCCIELPGGRFSWVPRLYQQIFDSLEAAKIKYTLHWGQEGEFRQKAIRRAYGQARIDSWLAARHRVLNTPELRQRFANDLLEDCGLDD
jgi:hypothetical protein